MITAEHILSWNFFLRWYSIIRDIIVTFLIHCADPSRKPSAFYHYEIKLLIGNFKRCLMFIFIQGFEPLGLARSIWQNWSWESIKALYEMPPVTPKVVSTPTITVQNKFTANFSLKDSSYEIEKFYSPKFFLKWDSWWKSVVLFERNFHFRGELIALDMYLFPIDIHKCLQQKVKMLKGYKGKFFPCTIQKCKRSDLPAIEHNVTKLKTLRGNKKKDSYVASS